MDQMKNAQKTFMKENKQLYDDTVQKRQRLSTEESMVVLQDESNQEMINAEEDFIQCLGTYSKWFKKNIDFKPFFLDNT